MKGSRQGTSKLSTAKERIKRFLTDADITLTGDEVSIMQRWEFADRLMMQGNSITSLLRQRIMDEFSVSVTTADNDIFAAQEVFGEARKINKRYLSHLHLQDIHADLVRIRKQLFKGEGDRAKIPDHREMQALAKLHDAYTYQLNSLPDTDPPPVVKRPIFMFSMVDGAAPTAPMALEDALKLSDEYINYEILPNGKTNMENGAAAGEGLIADGDQSP